MAIETFDLTDLNLTEPEAVPSNEYVPAYTDSSEPIDAGTYIVKFIDGGFTAKGSKDDPRPIRVGSVTSKKNGKTYLSVEFVVEVQDALVNKKPVGTRRVYGRVNTMPESLIFAEVKKGRENANGFMDTVIAAGWTGSLRSNDDYINAILTLIEKSAIARGRVDWTAYSNPNSTEYAGTGETFRGQKNYPLNADGSFNPRITDASGNTLLAKNELKAVYPVKK